MRVPCLSLWQPWASLIFERAKIHETRAWPPPRQLLGLRIVIHAAKRPIDVHPMADDDLDGLCCTLWGDRWREKLPLGKALGTVTLAGWRNTCTAPHAEPATPSDRIAGDWGEDRWAWRLDDPKAFEKSIPLRGRQGIWYEDLELPEVHA